MKKYCVLLLILFLLISCDWVKQYDTWNSTESSQTTENLFSPFIFQNQKELILSAYFQDPKKVQLIRLPEGVFGKQLPNGNYILEGNMLNPIDYIRFKNGNKTYDLIIKNTIDTTDFTSKNGVKPFITTLMKKNGDWYITGNQLIQYLIVFDNQLIAINKDTSIKGILPKEAQTKEYSYLRIYGYNEQQQLTNELLIPIKNGKIITNPSELAPTDMHKLQAYALVIDRFSDGNPTNNHAIGEPAVKKELDWQGGDFKGITQKIEEQYFSKLGCNTLILSPIFKNTHQPFGLLNTPYIRTHFSGFDGFAPISLSAIEPHFGTEDELNQLLSLAHKNNLHIILDVVGDVLHTESPLYKAHPNWFTHKNTKGLAYYDFSNKNLVESITDSLATFYYKFPIDGFRISTEKSIPTNMLILLEQKIKQRKSTHHQQPFYLLTDEKKLEDSKLHKKETIALQTDDLFYNNTINIFNETNNSLKEIEKLIQNDTYSTKQFLQTKVSGAYHLPRSISIIDQSITHTTDKQAITWGKPIGNNHAVGFKKMAQFIALQTTTKGIPILYYGDERGLPGTYFPDNQRMMNFSSNTAENQPSWLPIVQENLYSEVSKLNHFRKNNMALLYGETICIYSDNHCLVYICNYMNNTLLITFNTSANTQKITCEIPPIFTKKTWVNAFNSNEKIIIESEKISFAQMGNSYTIYQ